MIHRGRYGGLLLATALLGCGVLASCGVDQHANPAYSGCQGADGCERGEHCRRGYCVPDSRDSGSGSDDESIASPISGEPTEPGRNTPSADASTNPSTGGAQSSAPDASPSKPDGAPVGGQQGGAGGGAGEGGGTGEGGGAGADEPPPDEPPPEEPVGACASGAKPTPESCNGVDDDCDGSTDDLPVATCYTGNAGCSDPEGDGTFACMGACKAGIRSCGQGREACEGAVLPASAESCTESGAFAEDENCDGRADEGCACESNAVQTCFDGPRQAIGVGPCRSGTQTCADGAWSACSGARLPQAETCDGSDEDCDAKTDESFALQTDAANCGRCGTACASGSVCCAGRCIDVNKDPANCGACGHACTGLLQMCCQGVCKTLCLL